MLPKLSRLPRGEFALARRPAVSTPYFSVRTAPNRAKRNRIGVVVGIKVDKRAVKRNFWRREAKAALAGIPNAGCDLLVVVAPGVSSLTKRQFRDRIAAAARKAVNV